MRGATGTMIVSLRCDKVSIHAPHAGRDRRYSRRPLSNSRFNPRAPCGARRLRPRGERKRQPCFNPRAPCGARRLSSSRYLLFVCFNPRAPCGARRWVHPCLRAPLGFQSTRPMRGATALDDWCARLRGVSIHAPHAGRDVCGFPPHRRGRCFNPRAPCGARLGSIESNRLLDSFNPRAPCGARQRLLAEIDEEWQFQSTRPMRGATGRAVNECHFDIGFNPRAPCGARHTVTMSLSVLSGFNPRAPCGARPIPTRHEINGLLFQSTRPMRGATQSHVFIFPYIMVSIHAPHAGRDVIDGIAADMRGVSIHAPHAGRDFYLLTLVW